MGSGPSAEDREPREGQWVRLRVDLAYDGEPFHGFAKQKDLEQTVQGRLEAALRRVFGQDVDTTCSGRTDRGVHARGQVVHGDVRADHPSRGASGRTAAMLDDLDVARERLDHAVGEAITIWRVSVARPDFNARFSASRRHYRYRLVDAPAVDPLERLGAWHVRGGPLRLRPMQQALKVLVGEHDFASFCRKAPGKTTVREVLRGTVSRPDPGKIDVRLVGNAFCHNQVRSIVGCLVHVGRGEGDADWMRSVLEAQDRRVAARVAPPQGLILERVDFSRGIPSSPWID